MGLTSLQVCMDSPDWLQGNIHDDGMDSSSPSGDMLTACSRPAGLMERRLRPPQDHALKCPRCDSTHTKFCYYNNYSLSQPRYFCKTCRRYWTKGGTLRNIPVGGGCRKNKKVTSKKSSDNNHHNQIIAATSNVTGSSSSYYNNINQTDLHLSFPEMQLSHLGNLNLNFLGGSSATNNASFDFMESKLEAIVGASRNYDHFNGDLGMVGPSGLGDMGHLAGPNYGHNGFSYGLPTMDHHGNGSAFTDTCQRLMLPYDQVNANENQNAAVDVKPNPKLLTLDWHDHSNEAGKSSFGYMNNNNHLQGSWNGGGMMNGY